MRSKIPSTFVRHFPNDAVLIREQERASGAYLCDLV
jgi:hypothetical protein